MESARLHIETEREIDGRWIAEVREVPGALAYGESQDEAVSHALAIAFRVLAEDVERGEVKTARGLFEVRSAA